MQSGAPLGQRLNQEWYRTSDEYRQLRSGERMHTSQPKGNPVKSLPFPQQAMLPRASFPACRQYGDADVPRALGTAWQAQDPGSTLQEIRALKACDFERPRIDDHSIIASSRFDADIAFQDVLPHKFWIAVEGIAPTASA